MISATRTTRPLALLLVLVGLSAPAESLAWSRATPDSPWIGEVRFAAARQVGALSQEFGDHPFVLRNAPVNYRWLGSVDGHSWRELRGSRVQRNPRIHRIQRLPRTLRLMGLRLEVETCNGPAPVVRRLEIFGDPNSAIPAEPWIAVVNSTHDPSLPGHGQEFIPLARSCAGWENLGAQQVWVRDFGPEFLESEPRPLAVFFSGSFKDWCEVDRRHWVGTEKVLKRRPPPTWASCGGAQALAILADTGTRKPWDCPHCRDPRHPKLSIYGHIGHDHTDGLKCGDYSACQFERGPHRIRQLGNDPVFAGLPEVFESMESHCGQIEYPPKGWRLVATAGPGTRTVHQCLRYGDHPVYAAQFHIEMTGTPETSRAIMANFLRLAQAAAP
ncbi:MAG: hypothetical protein JNK85_08305 [Verrucomicrobiales bacterium]|nr:hypothetical protein [Verrucomicrobiales bacterium]